MTVTEQRGCEEGDSTGLFGAVVHYNMSDLLCGLRQASYSCPLGFFGVVSVPPSTGDDKNNR